MSKVDAKEFTKTQIEESGRWDKIPPEQRQAILDGAEGRMKTFGWIGPVVGSIFTVLIAAVLMGIFRFFYASDVGFKQALAITFWTSFAVALLTTPLMLGVLALKGDWSIDPGSVLQANLGLLVEKSSTAKPLWALLTSVDVFVLWMIFLLALGFGIASRKPTSSALWGVVVPWLVIVAIKVGLSALF
jgi:hypothetical protein